MSVDKKQKIVVLGDTGVGKTQLVHRIINEEGEIQSSPTIGVEFNVKYLANNMELNFWDTGGQEKYKSIVKVHFRSADALVFVYDTTNRGSFESIKKWLELSNDYVQTEKLVKILCGNKIDLRNAREVKENEANNFARQNGMIPIEVSAAKSINVESLTKLLAEKLTEKNWRKNKEQTLSIRDVSPRIQITTKQTNNLPKKTSCCC